MGYPLADLTRTERAAISNLFDNTLTVPCMLDIFEHNANGAADELVLWAIRNRKNIEREVIDGDYSVLRCEVGPHCRITVFV